MLTCKIYMLLFTINQLELGGFQNPQFLSEAKKMLLYKALVICKWYRSTVYQ